MPTKREPFHFVQANPGSERERRRESQLARSHTARVNRERRVPVRISGQPSAPVLPKRLVQRSSTHLPFPGQEEPPPAARGGTQTGARRSDGRTQSRTLASERSFTSSASSTSSATLQDDEQVSSALVPLPRTISPVLGAQTAPTFARAASVSETARATDYCLNTIWPNLLMDRHASATWFDAFREQPMIFHGFHYALAVHHDLLLNEVSWSQSRASLLHKTKTIKLLNDVLSNLNDENIEWAILAVLVLAANELKPENMITPVPSLFDPHLPCANWNAVYARMEQVPEHGLAMFMLIQKRGGLEHIKLPGLAGLLAFSDILVASYSLGKPVFPCFWPDELASLLWPEGRLFLSGAHNAGTGRGFREKVPSGLPQEAGTVYATFTIVDQAMDHGRKLQAEDPEMRKIVGARNRAHYRLLSLPAWTELDEIDQAIYDESAYECCRLTTLLYANEVIFPIPPNSVWPMGLLSKLVDLLTPRLLEVWSRDASSFLIWILVIAGVASFHTSHRTFFQKSLRDTVKACKFTLPNVAMRTAVRDFLWAEGACGRGFIALCDVLALEKVGAD